MVYLVSHFYTIRMDILYQVDCLPTYHIKIGAIEASQSRNNNRL
jgi:hypothetical protein